MKQACGFAIFVLLLCGLATAQEDPTGTPLAKPAPTVLAPWVLHSKLIQGDVVLYVVLGRDGNLIQMELISGHPILMLAAMDAVRRWQYRPYLLKDEPTEVETTVTVHFHM